MSYQELKKLYYKDHSQYTKEYETRFQSPDTVHLDFKIADKPAFFVETTEVLRLALSITQRDKNVTRLSESLPGIAKAQYSKKCLIDEIVLTNNIEGVHSSRKEIGEALDILEKQAKGKHKHARFMGLINKYVKLMSEEVIPLTTCQDIRDIYDEVFLEEILEEDSDNRPDGKIFRKGAESVYAATGKILHQGVYPEKKIIEYMEQALAFLNHGETQEIYRICLFHYLIEYIHPFYDGNGRLGRLILSYCISKTLEPLLAYRISETIKENVKEYYDAFAICNDPLNLGDLTPFLIMQLQMILDAMCDLEKSLEEKMMRWNRYTKKLIRSLPNATTKSMCQLYDYLIQAALFSEEGIPTAGLKELLEIKSHTTFKKMMDMIPENLLVIKTKNRVKYYEANLASLDDLMLKEELKAEL